MSSADTHKNVVFREKPVCIINNDHRFRYWVWKICVRQPSENGQPSITYITLDTGKEAWSGKLIKNSSYIHAKLNHGSSMTKMNRIERE